MRLIFLQSNKQMLYFTYEQIKTVDYDFITLSLLSACETKILNIDPPLADFDFQISLCFLYWLHPFISFYLRVLIVD